MKVLTNFVTTLIFAAWLVAIAIISSQNTTPISLKFFNASTITIPLGDWLALCVGIGVVGSAVIVPILFPPKPKKRKKKRRQYQFRESQQEDIGYQRDAEPWEDWGEEKSENW